MNGKLRRSFIRGLWGDRHITRWDRARGQIVDRFSSDEKEVALPCRVYCFGVDNHRYLSHHGIDSVLMHNESVRNFSSVADRDINADGSGNFGWSMWRHKIEILHAALQDFDEVLWLDSDVRLFSPLPHDFWYVLADGPPLRAKLYGNDCGVLSGYVAGGAFLYCRDAEVTSQLLALYQEQPTWSDMSILSVWIRRKLWKASVLDSHPLEKAWFAEGYEIPFCSIEPDQVRRPEHGLLGMSPGDF